MSETIYSIMISGAPTITGLAGTFRQINLEATTTARIWYNSNQRTIFYENGWKMGNSSDGTVYFKQINATDPSAPAVLRENPWDVPAEEWSSDIEAYKGSYLILIPEIDPGEIEYDPVITYENIYEYTIDYLFQPVKTYYFLQDDKYHKLTTITDSSVIAKNTYYEYNGTTYELTGDKYFDKKKTYYVIGGGSGNETDPYWYAKAEFVNAEVPSNTYYEITGQKTITTTVIVNTRTGATRKNVTTDVKSFKVQLDEHTRYVLPTIEAGKVYRFAFVKDFQALGYIKPTSNDYYIEEENERDSDITRGIYRVEGSCTYYELIAKGIDIYSNLYAPLGISKEVFLLDKESWMGNDIWYKLVDPAAEAKVYFIPSSIIDGIPSHDVAVYNRYQLIIDISVFKDDEMLADMITKLNLLFKANFGITPIPEIASYDSLWMPTSYYAWLENKRRRNISQFMRTNSTQYYNTLFKSEYNELYNDNAKLQSKVKAYEEIVNDLVKTQQ